MAKKPEKRPKTIEDFNLEKHSDWMSKLPAYLQTLHLSQLAIPGSHDSFAFDLSKEDGLAPDVKGSTIDKVAQILGSPAKRVIWKWSLTQRMDFTNQLHAGIRYFDLRVSTRPDTPDSNGVDALYLVHGMYGPKLKAVLRELKSFLDSHPREVILLDFNHFYRMDRLSHKKCVDAIVSIFGDKICPFLPDLTTLEWMWSNSYQVIPFYHNKKQLRQFFVDEEKIELLWDGEFIPSPWHNVSRKDDLIASLNRYYDKRAGSEDMKFYVTQGVLTPDTQLIVKNAASSLKKHCGKPAAPPYVEWLKTKEAAKVNICIMDFVEMEDYISTVISLNYKIVALKDEEGVKCVEKGSKGDGGDTGK